MDLHYMLKELGQFGKYQVFCFTVLLFPMVLIGFRTTEYIFTTIVIPHRCRVPECDGYPGSEQFETSWLHNAVPFTKHLTPDPYECLRYRPLTGVSVANRTSCSAAMFNQTETIRCREWVFSEPTRTIARDFNILCPGDYWMLTLLSSCFVIPSIIGRPLCGIVSDKYGRKTVLAGNCVVFAITGIIRSFSISYTMSVALESFDGFMGGSIYTLCFILGLEMLPSRKRMLGCFLICSFFSLGEVTLDLFMWYVQDWRLLLRIFYPPFLALVSLHWLLPESVRWLCTQNRIDDIELIFKRMAKMNQTEEKLQNVLKQLHGKESRKSDETIKLESLEVQNISDKSKARTTNKVKLLFHSHILMIRLIAFASMWLISLYTYYGISQFTAVFESSNRYLSFLLVSLVEVPARVSILWLPDWPVLGRRGTTAWSFFLCALTCFMLIFTRHDVAVLSLVLIAKYASTLTVTVVYVYSAEVFPTEVRHLTIAFCSMMGCIGTTLSQATPLIELHFNPMILFSLVSLLAGLFTLKCPETLHNPLPDTIEEAEKLGIQEITKL